MERIQAMAVDIAKTYGPGVLMALATLVVGWIVSRILTRILRRMMNKAKLEPTLVGFASNLSFALLMTLVAISALQRLGVPTTSFVAVVGAAGLAVGFALQGSLANFAAGVMLVIFRPFKVGDYIEGGGVAGIVEEIQVFATVLKTPDNRKVIAPNAALTSGTMTNFSANPIRRIDLTIGIGYGDDIKKAKSLLEQIMAADSRVLKDPAATVVVADLGDSSVNLAVRPWVNASDFWGARCDLIEAIKLRFDAEGISIPFPQRDVHIHQAA